MPIWAQDKKPLMDWTIEFRLRKELHFSSREEIDEMDDQKYQWFVLLLAQIDHQEKLRAEKAKRDAEKNRFRRRR